MQTSAVVAGLSKAVGTAPLSVLLAAGLELALLLTHAQVREQKRAQWVLTSAAGARFLCGLPPPAERFAIYV